MSAKWYFDSSNGFLAIAILVRGPSFISLTKLSLKVIKTYILNTGCLNLLYIFFLLPHYLLS